MNPVPGLPASQYMPFPPGSELPLLASHAQAAIRTSSASTADGVANGSLQFRGALSGQTPDASLAAAGPNTPPAANPSRQSGGFFAVLQNLMDQLDTMIGQLLGTPATPVSGGGSAGPAPGDGTIAAPPDGAPIAAPARREPL